jgi:hypothetical protein
MAVETTTPAFSPPSVFNSQAQHHHQQVSSALKCTSGMLPLLDCVSYPSQCISKEELEVYDGIPKSKHTIGLSWSFMVFCVHCLQMIGGPQLYGTNWWCIEHFQLPSNEDSNLTLPLVFSSSMCKYNVDLKSIRCLNVGTETIY